MVRKCEFSRACWSLPALYNIHQKLNSHFHYFFRYCFCFLKWSFICSFFMSKFISPIFCGYINDCCDWLSFGFQQVKLFSSLDCPIEVGLKYQDHFQAKTSSMLHSNSVESNGTPPGFEVGISVNQSKLQHFCIPRIQWQCPTKVSRW